MSLDFYLGCNHCHHTVESFNITHNLGDMWREAGVYEALYKSEGKKASEIVNALEYGVQTMKDNPPRFKRHDSPNGWGLYVHALPWLEKVLQACRDNPELTIRVWA